MSGRKNDVRSIDANVNIIVEGDVRAAQREYARRRMASLARYSRKPPQNVRLGLRAGPASRVGTRFYVARASVLVRGRLLAAHATGPTAAAATDAVSELLIRQMRGLVGSGVARRNDPAVVGQPPSRVASELHRPPPVRLKPPEERDIAAVRTMSAQPETTLGAVAELIERQCEFSLFRHARTGEDVTVHRRGDDDPGLLYPPGSPLADERELVVPEPSRYPEPIPLAAVRSALDVLNHRFAYFIDAEDQRGKVLYLRRDGDYALVRLG